jgi:hypothetical protein
MEVSGRSVRTDPTRNREAGTVFWKILGIVVLVWVALMVIGALIKMLIPVVVLGILVGGGYLVYKAVKGSGTNMTKY